MHPTPSRRRAGFTLIELLIVISIIAILLTLSASATIRVIDVQRGSNTEQTVKILSEVLDRHWQTVVDKALREEAIPSPVLTALKGMGITDHKVARVIYVKLKLRQQFPMSVEEVNNPGVLPAELAYVRALQGVTLPPGSESSVLLLLALEQTRSGTTFDADRLGSAAITQAGNTPLKQIIDGFGNPLAFYRWPIQNPELNPGGPQPGHVDATDPTGLLTDPAIANNNRLDVWFRSHVRYRFPGNTNGVSRSYKLQPVVVSPGRNGLLGLSATMAVTNPEQANDNVYSYRLRFGARGD